MFQLGALLGLCPEEEVVQDAQWLQAAQWLPVQSGQNGIDLLRASVLAQGSPHAAGEQGLPQLPGQAWRDVLVKPWARA